MNAKETLEITGMTCNHCARTVERTLKAVPGVQTASVDYASKRAVVEYDDNLANADKLIAAVNTTAYKAARLP